MRSDYLIKTVILSAIMTLGVTACAPTTTPEDVAKTQTPYSQTIESQNLVVVKKLYEDFGSGNMEGIIAALAPDVIWNESVNNLYAPDSPYIGINNVVSDVFGPIPTEWEYFKVNPESYMSDGDRVVMFGRYDAKYIATGKVMDLDAAHVWTLKDGKIIAYQQHMDTLAQQKAMTP